jgi:predicted ArsR family transcriptional regulator
VASPEPVSRDQAADGTGIARHTVKFHLDRLVEEGLLAVEFRRLSGRRGPGAGRPAKLYRRASDEIAVSLPERRYDLAGTLMAQAIDNSTREGTSVVTALHAAAARFGAALGRQARDAATDPTNPVDARSASCEVLAAHGYEPQLEQDTITLRNCPFHALAREHTELVCGMNLALVEAITEPLGSGLRPRLDPAEGRCCVVVTAETTPASS